MGSAEVCTRVCWFLGHLSPHGTHNPGEVGGEPYSRVVSPPESCLHCFIPEIPGSLFSDMGNSPQFPESGGLLFETSCKLDLLQLSQAPG